MAIEKIGTCRRSRPLCPRPAGYHARVQAGSTEGFLYLFLEVRDSHFDAQPLNVRPDTDRFDRVNLALDGPNGRKDYFFGTDAPGLIAAQSVVKGDDGADQVVAETRIQAFWLQTAAGYHLEIRIPLSFVGRHLWVEAQDGRGKGRAGFKADSTEGGRLFFPTAGLDTLLESYIGDGTRATVIDANALKLGTAGNAESKKSGAAEASEPIWYRYFLSVDTSDMPRLSAAPDHLSGASVSSALEGHPHAQWVLGDHREMLLTAAAPIVIDGRLHGAVVLEQAARSTVGAARPRAEPLVQPHPDRHRCRGHHHVRLRHLVERAHRQAARCRRLRGGQRRKNSPEHAGIGERAMRSALCRAASKGCWPDSMNIRNTCAPWAASCRTSCARR